MRITQCLKYLLFRDGIEIDIPRPTTAVNDTGHVIGGAEQVEREIQQAVLHIPRSAVLLLDVGDDKLLRQFVWLEPRYVAEFQRIDELAIQMDEPIVSGIARIVLLIKGSVRS